MNGMKVTVNQKDGTLTIVMPLISPPKNSASGKTLLVASTGGNKETEAQVNGQSLYLGLNAYIYATPKVVG